MTNTKFRRRALISSVAMLLVALVALGSATFAWFTENPVVTASGIQAKGEVSQGLEIWTQSNPTFQKNSNTLMTSTAIASGKELVLSPAYNAFTVSSDVKTIGTWLKTNALAGNASAAADNTNANDWEAGPAVLNAASSNMQLGTGIYKETVKVKVTSGDAAPIKLTGFDMEIAQNAGAISSGVTAIVVYDSKIVAMKKLGNSGIKVYNDAATGVAVKATADSTWAQSTVSASSPVTLGDAGTTDAKALAVDVYVYLDGTDDAVFTNNAFADDLLSSITLTFSK